MEELDKIYDVIKEMVNLGYTYQVDEKEVLGNMGLIKRTSLVKLKGHTMKLEETYKEDTKEVERVNAVIAEDNLENGHGNIINFNNEDWYKETEITGNILIIDIDYYSKKYDLSIGHSFGHGISNKSAFHSTKENNVRFYSKSLLKELQGLEEYFIGSREEYEQEKEKIKEKAKIIPNETVFEAVKKLDFEALKTGVFEHKTNDIIVDVIVEKNEPEKEKTLDNLRERINNLSPEKLKMLTQELEKIEKMKQEQEKSNTSKYSDSTMTRFSLYEKFLLDNGARKDLVELPAIKNIILDVIEHGDPRVKFEGRSPIVYMDPKEDGTFDIYGRMSGHTASVAYEMDLDEQEENGYYVCLTKKDIRNNDFLQDREPDQKIYIDREGKIIENLKGKTK